MKTADELWMIKPLMLLSLLVAVVHPDCDRRSGPAGVTECFLGLPYYSQYQCGTCLTNAYIIQKSGGRHICRDNASYCYYQCMIETYSVAEGPVYEGCSCVEGEPLPQADSILPADCYSPDGTDCSWYSRCLAARYPCSGHQVSGVTSNSAPPSPAAENSTKHRMPPPPATSFVKLCQSINQSISQFNSNLAAREPDNNNNNNRR